MVNIQGDEPFIDPADIDKAIKPFLDESSLNVSTLAVKITGKPDLNDENKVKVVMDKNGYALYFSRSCIPYKMNNASEKPNSVTNSVYYKHLGLYVFRKNYLLKFCSMKKSRLEKTEKLEQLRILENGDRIKVVITKKESFSVDTKKDLKIANRT